MLQTSPFTRAEIDMFMKRSEEFQRKCAHGDRGFKEYIPLDHCGMPKSDYFFNCIAYGSNATRSPTPKPKSRRNLRSRVLNGVG